MPRTFSAEDNEPVTILNARCIAATERAICVRIGASEAWVPQSLVHDDSEVWRLDDRGALVVPRWLARERGWLSE